uniref:Phosphatidylinositol N-acetylglucosaminyltransferase n=1 Tax=Octactis speculum TaxID=3111310 RepID=A0A7S2DRR2_9STRA
MRYKVCYTDHSLFGFADAASIHINKVLQFTLSDVDEAICVSNTCRENLVLRAGLHPGTVSTIPNAVDPTKFVPDPTKRFPSQTINIVMISRLVYRKGIDLAARVIPVVCQRFPNVHFIIGGDGPKKLLLEEMREKYQLDDRVELLGAVPYSQVRNVLVRGHIFLNCSLTESFCIAILEAACCGLVVVSTQVGGVPEVLPKSMIKFATPEVHSLVDAVGDAIASAKKIVPSDFHEQVNNMYSWADVALRTELVYARVVQLPTPSLTKRFRKYRTVGPFAGLICCFIVAALHLYLFVLEYMDPAEDTDMAPQFPHKTYFKHARQFHNDAQFRLMRKASPPRSDVISSKHRRPSQLLGQRRTFSKLKLKVRHVGA